MAFAFFDVPVPHNEAVLSYAPGTKERAEVLAQYKTYFNEKIDIPMYIGGKEVFTSDKVSITPPHDHKHVVGTFNRGSKKHFEAAISTALQAKKAWATMPWEQRAAIFLRAADLVSGPYRAKINASTMIAQSKNMFQAEIDAACEFADFLRFNVKYMTDIYKNQPESAKGIWNRLEYRPLEGFVFAITPFNFTSIAGNLPFAPALMGNVAIWKPADAQIYSAKVIMDIYHEAGVPAGVINMIYGNGPEVGEVVFNHPEFAGLHFTGSTGVFRHLWTTIGNNIAKYRSYPKIVGETGGKDFIVAHSSARAEEVSTGISRGAFEFQGQKCSAASRAYIPKSLWPAVKKNVLADLKSMKMGAPDDTSNFINAVIDERAFDKIRSFIEYAKSAKDAEIVAGGKCDKSKGYFIEPTVIVTTNPKFKTICEEIFGPVITIYIYEDKDYEATLKLVDETSEYALTGAVFSRDRYAIDLATDMLRNSAGNFYVNDKPTGAVVGQQPFGGGRGSGTNDKAGSYLNLIRWVSPRTIKETFNTATNYKYPFLD